MFILVNIYFFLSKTFCLFLVKDCQYLELKISINKSNNKNLGQIINC